MLRTVGCTAPRMVRGLSVQACQRVCTPTLLSHSVRYYTPSSAPTYTPPQQLETITTTSTPTPTLHKISPPKYARNYGPSVPDSFAVVVIGGKQYKVTKGDVITTETLQVDVGEHIVLDKVLLVGTKDYTAIGAPILTQAKVAATIEEQTRLAKVYIFKKKRRKTFQKTQGHRQNVTVMRITDIFMDPTDQKI